MPGRILIVEQDEPLRTLFVRALRAEGVDSDEIVDGQGAVAAIRSGRYQVVILDVEFAVGNGFDVLRTIEGDARHPIILVLSKSADDARQVAGDPAVLMCINKTFAMRSPDPVMSAVAAVARIH